MVHFSLLENEFTDGGSGDLQKRKSSECQAASFQEHRDQSFYLISNYLFIFQIFRFVDSATWLLLLQTTLTSSRYRLYDSEGDLKVISPAPDR